MEEQIFDRLCLDAWKGDLPGDQAVSAAELIFRLADLRPGYRLLDLGCGVGQIANAIAAWDVRVTGVDRSHEAIARAGASAEAPCTFIECDWRDFEASEPFDCVLFWRTTLCAGDEEDYQILCHVRGLLGRSGTLLVEMRHWDRMERTFQEKTMRHGDNYVLVESHSYDPLTGIQTSEEHYSGDDVDVRRRYHTRRYTFAELRGMCRRAGFDRIDGFDETGKPLSNYSHRAILRARMTEAR